MKRRLLASPEGASLSLWIVSLLDLLSNHCSSDTVPSNPIWLARGGDVWNTSEARKVGLHAVTDCSEFTCVTSTAEFIKQAQELSHWRHRCDKQVRRWTLAIQRTHPWKAELEGPSLSAPWGTDPTPDVCLYIWGFRNPLPSWLDFFFGGTGKGGERQLFSGQRETNLVRHLAKQFILVFWVLLGLIPPHDTSRDTEQCNYILWHRVFCYWKMPF